MSKDLDEQRKWELLSDVLWNIERVLGNQEHTRTGTITKPLGELSNLIAEDNNYPAYPKKLCRMRLQELKEKNNKRVIAHLRAMAEGGR